MRCVACDCLLSNFEATRKNHETKEYYDLCNKCMPDVTEDEVDERYDLYDGEEDTETHMNEKEFWVG